MRLSRAVIVGENHREAVVHHVTRKDIAAATGEVVVLAVKSHHMLIAHDVSMCWGKKGGGKIFNDTNKSSSNNTVKQN